jgi:hypothetical protein
VKNKESVGDALTCSPICLIPNRLTHSPIWSHPMKVRHLYLRGREIKINNGHHVSFWFDPWLVDIPLCQTYPMMFELVVNEKCSVNGVKTNG